MSPLLRLAAASILIAGATASCSTDTAPLPPAPTAEAPTSTPQPTKPPVVIPNWHATHIATTPWAIPATWTPAKVVGSQRAYKTPSGAQVGLSISSRRSLPITANMLHAISATVAAVDSRDTSNSVELTPQLVGRITFNGDLAAWIVRTPHAVVTMTMRYPIKHSKPITADDQATGDAVAQHNANPNRSVD